MEKSKSRPKYSKSRQILSVRRPWLISTNLRRRERQRVGRIALPQSQRPKVSTQYIRRMSCVRTLAGPAVLLYGSRTTAKRTRWEMRKSGGLVAKGKRCRATKKSRCFTVLRPMLYGVGCGIEIWALVGTRAASLEDVLAWIEQWWRSPGRIGSSCQGVVFSTKVLVE